MSLHSPTATGWISAPPTSSARIALPTAPVDATPAATAHAIAETRIPAPPLQ